MEKVIERLKKEEEKILKLLENNVDNCWSEDTQIKNANDYQTTVGLLVNVQTTILQFEQMLEIKKRNEEQLSKMQEEAKQAK